MRYWTALFVPSPALITPLPANISPNKPEANVAASIPKNPPFYSYTSFTTVLVTNFINKPKFSKDLILLMISLNS